MQKKEMSTWLDFEMGADMTRQIEYGDNVESPRMSMLPMCIPQKQESLFKPKQPLEEKVKAACSEKTEG